MASDKHVLYLTHDGLCDPLGQSQILPYLTGLSSKGIQFTIISLEKADAYAANRAAIEQICEHHNINWMALSYHQSPPVLATLFDLWRMSSRAKQLMHEQGIQLIHCRSYVTSLVGLRLKRQIGVPFLFDMRGFWADERVEGGLWNLKNPLYRIIYRFFKKKEKDFLIGADHIVSLTENAKQEIQAWDISAAPISVIPTCVDLDLFDPAKIKAEDQIAVRNALGIKPTDFVVLYLGSWGTWYLTQEMLAIFKKLKYERPDAKFLIVTADKIQLLDEGIIVTKANRTMVPLYISLANVALCFIKPTYSKKASSATKLGEILAMGIPVVANSGWGDIDVLFQKRICFSGLAIEKLSVSKSELRAYCMEELNIQKAIAAYHEIYQLLIKE